MKLTNDEILAKAYWANSVLRERQKSVTKEHTERRKKLTALMDSISKARMTGQGELVGVAHRLSRNCKTCWIIRRTGYERAYRW